MKKVLIVISLMFFFKSFSQREDFKIIRYDENVLDHYNQIQEALDSGGKIKFQLGKKWRISKKLVATRDIEIDLNKGSLYRDNGFRIIDVESNYFTLKNGEINTSFDTKNAPRDLFGLLTIDNQNISVAEFDNLKISAPKANTQGIKVIAQSRNSVVDKLVFKDVYVNKIGSVGIEVIGSVNTFSTQNFINKVYLTNIHTKSTGIKDEEGMGVSIAASVHSVFGNGIFCEDFTKIGFEIGSKYGFIYGLNLTNARTDKTDYIYSYVNIVNKESSDNDTNIVFDGVNIQGDKGRLNIINKTKNSTRIKNLSIYGGDIKILGDNYEIIDSCMDIGGNIDINKGQKIKIINSTINFNNGNRFQLQGGTLDISKGLVTRINKSDDRVDDGQMLFLVKGSTLTSEDTEFYDGYINGQEGTQISLKNTHYIRSSGDLFLHGKSQVKCTHSNYINEKKITPRN